MNRCVQIDRGGSGAEGKCEDMRCLKYVALLAVLMIPLAYSQAQVSVGIGFGPGYVTGPPVCDYGYYGSPPYACAPYGYYGPNWFVGGAFLGAGPWDGGYYGRGGWGYGRGSAAYSGRGFARGPGGGYRGSAGGGFHGGAGGFHGGGGHGRSEEHTAE